MEKRKTTEFDYKNISDDVYDINGDSINKTVAEDRYKVLAVEDNKKMECRQWQ